MTKFYYYLDLGSGYQLVNPVNNTAKLALERGEFNDVIQRKQLKGSFSLHAEYATAYTHFRTNGFENAALRIYENGIVGVGTLIYEGLANISGLWDNKKELIKFDKFTTVDRYSEIIAILNNNYEGFRFGAFDSFSNIMVQGQDTNSNKLYNISKSGSTFVVNGSSTTIPNLARCSVADTSSGEVILYDQNSGILYSYTVIGTEWVQKRSLQIYSKYDHAIATYRFSGNDYIAMLGSHGYFSIYEFDGTTSFKLVIGSDDYIMGSIKFPCITAVAPISSTYIAKVSEDSSSLIILNNGKSISIGQVVKPHICTIDSNLIALIDAKQQLLRTFEYSGTTGLSEIGEGTQLLGLYAPKICLYTSNQIILHDAIAGRLEKYNWSGTAWTKDGDTFTLKGGYTSAIATTGSNIFVAMADTFYLVNSWMYDIWTVINNILFLEDIWGYTSPLYEVPETGAGYTIDLRNVIIGDMGDVADNLVDSGNESNYQFNINDMFKLVELFGQYWYIDSARKIKFTQPNLFSSFGTDIDISSLLLADGLNQELCKEGYTIDREEDLFVNGYNEDFVNNSIDYLRNTSIIQSNNYKITTDFQFLIDNYIGINNRKIEQSGLIMYYNESGISAGFANSGTGIVSAADTRNIKMSQSQIYNDYRKDYLFKDSGSVEINGVTSAVQDTCRDIIEYPDVEVNESMIGLTTFPDSVANLIWDGGLESYITLFEMELATGKIIIKSRKLDL